MLRRVLAVVCAVSGAVLLSGCTPEIRPLAGVTVDGDGSPRVLVRPCGDAPYTAPTLMGWAGSYEDEPGEDETDTTVWETDGEWSGDADFPLFSPPAAWDAEARGEQRLRSGHTYAFVFYGHTDDQANGSVSFTPADLARLKPGRVWADDRVMDTQAFEDLAERAC
ncbi:hypothetical protein [Streptomyces stelliscabiei]|uniref:hypothetical protein n=1 Tax=Streptomyces stelliscabiei TaxID=146820 RepID=UPI0029A959CB|nr:hypothetical protein [Streptomyces stelliscabiei]MDX2554472.1 hypothetical protein [Streptomyces stelliscabiei]MDX2613681.1 hypothetical protein [Streptomyces stelliscabiei]MDX2639275.1 hypothetical protein [Streptomyces stelliscabiei]MDX2662960.1 hypothetical protein [Streptomyces stelliscabiei]MDX2715525.1 hypothetical protein [Streptomyces stelliscabiei]